MSNFACLTAQPGLTTFPSAVRTGQHPGCLTHQKNHILIYIDRASQSSFLLLAVQLGQGCMGVNRLGTPISPRKICQRMQASDEAGPLLACLLAVIVCDLATRRKVSSVLGL